METKTVERNWGLDLLRILAAFTVVMLHVSPQAYLDVEIASAPWNVMNAITGLSAGMFRRSSCSAARSSSPRRRR